MALKTVIGTAAKNLSLSLIKALAPTTAAYLGKAAASSTNVTVYMSANAFGPQQFGHLHGEGETATLIYPLQSSITPQVGDKVTIASKDYGVVGVRDLTEGEGQCFELSIFGDAQQYLG